MIEHWFALIPFSAPGIPAVSLTGNLSFHKSRLHLHYSLEGEIEEIVLPPISLHPGRKDDLWRATCFECFLAIKGKPEYWELNFSPSGDWNVYHMAAYRRVGFREETAISPSPFEFKKESGRILLDVEVDLAMILHPGDEVQLGVTAILQTRDGNETYWALAHSSPHADFHRRECLILELAERTHLSEGSAPGG
jgi:hypothetical protein